MKRLVFFLIIFTNIACTAQQKWAYKKIPAKYNRTYHRTEVPKEYLNKAVNAAKYLPKGFTKNGGVDYTTYLQKALDENEVVVIPKGVYATTGLFLKSNAVLIFAEGAKLQMIPSTRERYQILAVWGADNVTIYNAHLIGDLKRRTSKNGEWGFGVDIRGSKNVSVYSPYIKNVLGDGIIISSSTKGMKNRKPDQIYSASNILIQDAFIDFSGRNGISIIDGEHIRICAAIIINTINKHPRSGIDIEPDHSKGCQLNDIVIDSLFTFNNVDGIMITLRNFVGYVSKEVNITINDHVDVGGKFPINFPGVKRSPNDKQLRGIIEINNPLWINNKQPLVRNNSNGLYPYIIINSPTLKKVKVKNWKGKNVTKLGRKEMMQLHIKDTVNFEINY